MKHLEKVKSEVDARSKPRDLLSSDNASSDESIWLIATTKKHIVPQKRLKPTKVLLSHSLNTSPTLSICLITPDPQKAFKGIIAHKSFPNDLSRRISRVIDIKKLEKKYHSFEAKRQLRDTYDIFLADDRIITYLPKILGKTFYTSTRKRPIPVCLRSGKIKKEKGKATLPNAKTKDQSSDSRYIVTPDKFAHEIERTLRMTTVNLTPSATTTVRVGLASFTPRQLIDNIEDLTGVLMEKHIPKKWKGLKAIHIKSPNSMALPIWLTDQLWEEEEDVLDPPKIEQARTKASPKKKRRRMLDGEDDDGVGKKPRIEDARGAGSMKSKRRMQISVMK